jgi:hypothetical protein
VGIGCVLFLWSLLAAAAAIVAIVSVFMLVSGIRRRRRVRAVIGAVLSAAGGGVALIAVAFVVSWLVLGNLPYSSTSPRVFRDEFGFAAPSDVASLQCEAFGSTDSVLRFIRFRSSSRTIDTIVSSRFKQIPPGECEGHLRTLPERRPDWWLPELSATSRCYVAAPFDDTFASNDAWLIYDAASGDAHYNYSGVD